MVIEKIKVERLNPAPYNPRVDLQKGDAEYEHIENSINSFGLLEPIVWNQRTGNIVSGHQRFKIMCEHGAKEVDCIVVDFDEDKEKACNLAMNKATGLWEYDKMNALLDELAITDWKMDCFGFDISSAVDWAGVEELSEATYDEPEKDMLRCPKCGHIDSKTHFIKVDSKEE